MYESECKYMIWLSEASAIVVSVSRIGLILAKLERRCA